MRILYLSQLIPYPADAGPKVRSYHVIQHLAARGHKVTLVAFKRKSDRAADIEHMRQYCVDVRCVPMARSRARDLWYLGRSLLCSEPFLIVRDLVAAMHETIDEALSQCEFDVIHADQLWMAQYALAARKRIESEEYAPYLVLDQHNAVFLISQRLAENSSNLLVQRILKREASLLEHYERRVCAQFDRVVWVTDEDQRALTSTANDRCTSASGVIIPICINPDEKRVIQRLPHARRVTFLGGLHWPPNADGIRRFAYEVWPRIIEQAPTALLTIIGKDPPDDLVSAVIPGIEVSGFVRDLLPYLRETAVFIVPLHAGGGMRVKIIDAWSWGLPIVSTTIGAEGLAYRDGENLLLADAAETFAGAVVRILSDAELGQRLGAAGRATVEKCYDWRHVYGAWDTVYRQGP